MEPVREYNEDDRRGADRETDDSLSVVLVGVGAVAVGLGVAARHFGADATLGLIMVAVGISGFRRRPRSKAAGRGVELIAIP